MPSQKQRSGSPLFEYRMEVQTGNEPENHVQPRAVRRRRCVRGMRIRVKHVLDLLAVGVRDAEILKDVPYLEQEDIAACSEYAAVKVDHPVLIAR